MRDGPSDQDGAVTATTTPGTLLGPAPGTPAVTGPPAGRRPTVALVLAGVCSMVVGYTATGVNIAFPEVERAFSGTSRSTLSWGVAGYSIVLAALLLPAGRLADLRGRRRLFVRGLAVFGAGSLAIVLAPAGWVFLAGRVVQAGGAAAVLPGALALVLPEFPDDRRVWVAGTMTSLVSLSQAFAPTVAALLVDLVGWRSVFVPPVVASAAGVLLGTRVFHESEAQESTGPVDRVGFPMGSGAVALLAFAVIEGPRWGWSAPLVAGSLVAAVVLFPAFVVRSRRHPRPLMDPKIVARRSVWSATLGYFFVAALGQTLWFVLPQYLKALRGYSLLRIGLAMTPMAFASAAAGWAGTRLTQRTGRPRPQALAGAAIMAVGALCFVVTGVSDGPFALDVLPGVIITGLGIGLSQAPLAGLSLLDVERAEFGQVNGVLQTMRFVGGAMGTAAVVALLGDATVIPAPAFRRVFVALFAAMLACLAIDAMTLPGRRRRVARRSPG